MPHKYTALLGEREGRDLESPAYQDRSAEAESLRDDLARAIAADDHYRADKLVRSLVATGWGIPHKQQEGAAL